MNKFRYCISFILVLLLQTTVFPNLVFFSMTPSLILPYIAWVAILHGPTWGGYTGLALGLMEDVMFSEILGIHALLFFLIGTGTGIILQNNEHNLPSGMLLVAMASIFMTLGEWLIRFLLRTPVMVLWQIGLPMASFAFANALLFLLLMPIMRRWMKRTSSRHFQRF